MQQVSLSLKKKKKRSNGGNIVREVMNVAGLLLWQSHTMINCHNSKYVVPHFAHDSLKRSKGNDRRSLTNTSSLHTFLLFLFFHYSSTKVRILSHSVYFSQNSFGSLPLFRTVLWFLKSGSQRGLWLSADPENEWQYFQPFSQRHREKFYANFYSL